VDHRNVDTLWNVDDLLRCWGDKAGPLGRLVLGCEAATWFLLCEQILTGICDSDE